MENITLIKYSEEWEDYKRLGDLKSFCLEAIMTTGEVAKYLNISKQMVVNNVISNKFPYLKNTNNGYLFYKYDIKAFAKYQENKKKPYDS